MTLYSFHFAKSPITTAIKALCRPPTKQKNDLNYAGAGISPILINGFWQ